MAFCTKCGSQVEGRFCKQCGAAVDAPVSGETYVPVTQVPAGGLSENAASALCYLAGLITGVIFLVLEPYNRNPRVRFHAFQSIFLNVAWIVLFMILGVLLMTPGLMMISGLFHAIFSLAGFLLWLFLMWKAYEGQSISLPVIGPMAQKQAGKS